MHLNIDASFANLRLEDGRLHLDIEPDDLIDVLSEENQRELARMVATLRPFDALPAVLDYLRDADDAQSLHAALHAVEQLRKDLQTWLEGGEVWENRVGHAGGKRALTSDELRRIAEAAPVDPAVGVTAS